ncbi:molybdopterin-guanine dinucleotide biosynthesis protein MobA [compost metagenome]|jgi:molybdenum cofactor cytidylyltransferase|uniref:nucleotidyltransferase family protein n=1 Tax=Achromobacter sp. TaxID=134375 RepID=UPI000FBA3EA1
MPSPVPDSPPSLTPSPASPHCVGVLLAAGHGRRYAAAAPGQDKLLVLLGDGTPVAVACARALRQATARTIAVLRADQTALRALLESEGCEIVVVKADANGMGDSLATAARHLMQEAQSVQDVQTLDHPTESACLIALADMPWLRADTCLQVAAATRRHRIVAPTWQGRRGHPVAFARDLWPELAALSGDVGARSVLMRHPVHELALDDPGVLADVDAPGDLVSKP